VKYLPLLWSSLGRRKVRSLLTFLSIVVAFVLFGYLGAIERALDAGVSVAGADRLFVRHKVSITQPLPESYQARLAALPGVDAVAFASWFGGIYQEPRNFFAQMAVVPEEWLALYPEYLLSEEQRQAWLKTRTGAIAGRKLAERFGWKVGDRIPIQATIWRRKDNSATWEFDLVGIYDGREKGTDTTQFFFRHDYFDEARLFGEGLVGWYIVRVNAPDQAAAIAQRIDEEFANSPAETKTEPEGAFAASFAKQMGDIGFIMTAILSAVFFTILLVAGNTMAQTVRERTEEIGVLKALGFTNVQVLALVLAESCLLALLAGSVGLGVAWLATSGGDPTGGALPMFYFPRQRLLSGVGLMVALGLASGLFPALQAMRLRVAEALRRAG
jgi:putative ABC transport system permease protein